MSRGVEDYALLGDGLTAALVSRSGSIDWLCWPRFDSDSCFTALLGGPEHGCWRLSPTAEIGATSRRYQSDSLVLETDFETAEGAVRLMDFMPAGHPHSSVVRLVVGLRGKVNMRSALRLRFDYGMTPPWLQKTDDGFVAWAGPDRVTLRTPAPVRLEDDDAQVSDFEVAAGARVAFVLTHTPSADKPPAPLDAEAALVSTQSYWRDWIGRFDAGKTRWPEQLKRSLITLKALIHRPTGGLVAAPTTSLPEAPGGELNWDYRYCWLRDSTFTVGAFLNAGFTEEAREWRDWLLRAVAGVPGRMQIMYRIDGGRRLSEWKAEYLQGFRHAKPVRIGNAAAEQTQIDVYGEVLDCFSLARKGGLPLGAHEEAAQIKIVEHLARVWDNDGAGIWESRGESRPYTYSKAVAWAGVDRVLRFLKSKGDNSHAHLIGRLEALRTRIHETVCRDAWDEGLGSFTQYFGGLELDASLLLLPALGFLPADDPRMKATIEAVQQGLGDNGFLRRKAAISGKPEEGAFLACSCWLADCLAAQGRREEAQDVFQRVLGCANDLGLLSEEYDTRSKRLAGNFPQALTHLAVVNTGLGLSGWPLLQRGGG